MIFFPLLGAIIPLIKRPLGSLPLRFGVFLFFESFFTILLILKLLLNVSRIGLYQQMISMFFAMLVKITQVLDCVAVPVSESEITVRLARISSSIKPRSDLRESEVVLMLEHFALRP